MNELKIEYLKVKTLTHYANNSRTHSIEQLEQIVRSINEFGFTNPILIDENNGVIAGHGRLMACDKADISKVPCVRLKGLSETQKKAYVIADNSLALNADWDIEKLQFEFEFEGLKELGFDIDLLSIDFEALDINFDDLENEQGLTDEDAVPSVDELNKYLSSEHFAPKLKETAAEIRKTNGILIMAVQSAKTIFENKTYQEMKDNISTYILYPNSKADAQYYVDEIGLNTAEFDWIKTTGGHREVMVKKNNAETVILNVDLSILGNHLRVFNSSSEEVAVVKRLQRHYPKNWLEKYLEG